MEKVIGPTISVSTSGATLIGWITDSTSGAYGYKFNKSTSPGTISNNISGASTAEQSYVLTPTSTGTWYLHAKDIATNTSSSEAIRLLRCSICNVITSTIHYKCSDPTHGCSTIYGQVHATRAKDSYCCGDTHEGTTLVMTSDFVCQMCGALLPKDTTVYFARAPHITFWSGDNSLYWCLKHGRTIVDSVAPYYITCTPMYYNAMTS